jgi:hypothetical protein
MIDPFSLPEPVGLSKTKDQIRELRRVIKSMQTSFGPGERGLVTQSGVSRYPARRPGGLQGGGKGSDTWAA